MSRIEALRKDEFDARARVSTQLNALVLEVDVSIVGHINDGIRAAYNAIREAAMAEAELRALEVILGDEEANVGDLISLRSWARSRRGWWDGA